MNAARRFSPVWLAVAGLVFVLNLAMHLPVEDFFDEFAKRFGFVAYDTTTRHGFFVIAVLALVAAWLWPSGRRLALGTATTVLIGAALLAQRLIVVVAIENIHYPQYIVLLVLLALALPGLELAWIVTVGLGCIDEAFQLLDLPRGTTPYFDWNDIVLDGIGAAFGVVIVLLLEGATRSAARRATRAGTRFRSSTRWAVSAAALLVAFAISPPTWSPFFNSTPGGRLFHKVVAPEAMFVLVLLWWGASVLANQDEA